MDDGRGVETSTEPEFGAHLRTLRLRLGLRMVTVAERGGMTMEQLTEAEAGRSEFSLDDLNRIAKGLDVALWEVFRFWEFAQAKRAE